MRETDELLDLSRFAGTSPAIAQGAGGNVSVKTTNGAMWIKASGYRLSALRPGVGYLAMRTPKAAELSTSVRGLDSSAANIAMSRYLQSLVFESTQLRPSLETWFHAVLGRVVLHTHPIYANAFACMEGGREALATSLTYPVAWVGYQAPGHRLGEAVYQAANRFEREQGAPPARLILENHGLITVAHTGTEAIALTNEILNVGRKFFGPLPRNSFKAATSRPRVDRWSEDLAREFAGAGLPRVVRPARYELLYRVARLAHPQFAPVVPDDVVCNGPAILSADHSRTAGVFLADNRAVRDRKATIFLPGDGFVFAADSATMVDAMEEQLLANILVRELISRHGVCRSLPQTEIADLLAMESEKYRRQVLADGGVACRS